MKTVSSQLKRAALSVAAATTMLAALVGAKPAPAVAAEQTVSIVQSGGTPFCLGIVDLTDRGRIPRQVGCDKTDPRQRWVVKKDTTNAGMTIGNTAFNLCLAVKDHQTGEGFPITGADCSPETDQLWLIVQANVPSNGIVVLQNVNSHLCVRANSANYSQQRCDLTSTAPFTQLFTLVP